MGSISTPPAPAPGAPSPGPTWGARFRRRGKASRRRVTLRERKVVVHGAPSGPVHGPDSRSRRNGVSRGSCLSCLTRPGGRLDRCGSTVGILVDGGRSTASVFVRCLMEVRRSRSRARDHRVRRGRLLLAADRAHRFRVFRGRQRCSPRLASAWGSMLERLLRTDWRQSVCRRRAAALRGACCVSWQRPQWWH